MNGQVLVIYLRLLSPTFDILSKLTSEGKATSMSTMPNYRELGASGVIKLVCMHTGMLVNLDTWYM